MTRHPKLLMPVLPVRERTMTAAVSARAKGVFLTNSARSGTGITMVHADARSLRLADLQAALAVHHLWRSDQC